VIPATTKNFIENLVDYYISEAASYKQMAKIYAEEAGDIPAATFGLIVGSIYSAFLQAYDNQRQKPPIEDVQEFGQIIKRRAAQIKKSILDAKV
jgi:methionine synthase II (cobalamin-independent)